MINRTEQEIMHNWKGEIDKPIVSVCTITYNHEKYITEAIDSFLMQETDFPFEVVIGEDFSTDSTRRIIEEYIKKYSNIIKLITSEQNVGIQENGKRTMEACRGKYIALCEGDDYWTDTKKLHIQKYFLDCNKDYSAIAHQVNVLLNKHEPKRFNELEFSTLELNDILFERKFHTASVMCRGYIIKKHPLPVNILSADKAYMILLALFGKIYFHKNIMGVYRKHEGGISSWVTDELMKKDLNLLPWILSISPVFPKFRLISYIHKTIVMYPIKISVLNIFRHSFLFIYFSFSYFPFNIRHLGEFIFKVIPLKIVDSFKN